MFKFLKDKLKSAISKFSEKAEEESAEEQPEEAKPAESEPEEKVPEEPKEEPATKEEPPRSEKEEEVVEEQPEEKPLEEESDTKEEPPESDKEKREVEEQPPEKEEKPEPEEPPAKEEPEEGPQEEKPKEPEEETPEPEKEEEPEDKEPEVEEKPTEEKPEEEKPEEADKAEPEKKPPEEAPAEEPEPAEPEDKGEAEEKKEPEKKAAPEKADEKKGFFQKIADHFKKSTEEEPGVKEEPGEPDREQPAKETTSEPEEDKPGFLKKLTRRVQTVSISEQRFEELFWELEVVLLENSVAVEVIEKIKEDLKKKLVEQPVPRGAIQAKIVDALQGSISDLFSTEALDLIEAVKQKKPYVICFVGVNGSGKTTTIAKVAHLLKTNGLGVVMAAADTFRAAAIDQLQLHADKLAIRMIRHDYGSDAAAVAFDAIKHAESKGMDAVLIDTAGRLHSNTNLMDELKKVVRVAKPDMTIFVGESITGNDCVEQAKLFQEAVDIDAIILSKADIDEKGGAAISISHVTGKPILYIGTGQGYSDLTKFDRNVVIENLGLSAS
jgi:fused signal recognition particle receptor